jgi:hypothetical protein
LSGNRLKSRLGQEIAWLLSKASITMGDLGALVADARLKNRAGVPATTTMSRVVECRAAAKVTADTKPAQNIALPCAQKSLGLILVGAKSTVRIT